MIYVFDGYGWEVVVEQGLFGVLEVLGYVDECLVVVGCEQLKFGIGFFCYVCVCVQEFLLQRSGVIDDGYIVDFLFDSELCLS